MDPPPCVQNAMMKQDKKPFTYTPGGIDLSEIKSPRMARRIERNANYNGPPEPPRSGPQQPVGPLPPSALAAMQPQMHVQVFPSGPPPPAPKFGPPPPPPPPSNIPPPPPPPSQPLPTQKVVTTENQVLERPDMTKIIPDNPMALLRKTGGPQQKSSFIDEMYGAKSMKTPPIQPQQPRSPPVQSQQPRTFTPQQSPLAQPQQTSPPVQQAPRWPQNQAAAPAPQWSQSQASAPAPQWAQNQTTAPSPVWSPPSQSEPPKYQPKVFERAEAPTPEPQRYQPKVIERVPSQDEPMKTSTAHLGSLYIPPINQQQQQQTNVASPPTPPKRDPQSPQIQSPSTPTLKEAPKPWQKQPKQAEELPPWAKKESAVPPVQQDIQSPQVQRPMQRPPQERSPVQQQQNQHPNAVYITQPLVFQHPGPVPSNRQPQPRIDAQGSILIPVQIERKVVVVPGTPGTPGNERSLNRQQSWGTPTQSNSFKVLQKLTQTDADEEDDSAPVTEHGPRYPQQFQQNVPVDQMKKLKLSEGDKELMNRFRQEEEDPRYRGGVIPSRVFRILDESGVDDDTSLHNEVDPRYRGPAIPSKAFKLLQSMTDGSSDTPVGATVSRGPPPSGNRTPQVRTIPIQIERDEPPKNYVPPSEQTVPEPKKYTGSSIPSRSFKILQAMTAPDSCANANEVNENYDPSSYNQWGYDPNYPPPYPPYWPDYYYNYYYQNDTKTNENERDIRQTPVPFWGYYPPPSPYPYMQPPLRTPDIESDSSTARNTPLPWGYYPPYYAPTPTKEQEEWSNYQESKEEGSNNPQNFVPPPPSPYQYPPYWDPYYYYYGYPPLYSPYPFYEQIENEEFAGYSSTDEMAYFSQKFKTERGEFEKEESKTPQILVTPSLPQEVKTAETESERDSSESDSETEVETEEERFQTKRSQSSNGLQAIRSVKDIRVYDEDDEEQKSDEEEDDSDENEDTESVSYIMEQETIPHQLSVIFEESERSDSKRESSVLSDSTTIADKSDDEEDDEVENSTPVSVKLPLKFKIEKTENEEITTVTVGESEIKLENNEKEDEEIDNSSSPAKQAEPETEAVICASDEKTIPKQEENDTKNEDEEEEQDWWGILNKDDDVLPVRPKKYEPYQEIEETNQQEIVEEKKKVDASSTSSSNSSSRKSSSASKKAEIEEDSSSESESESESDSSDDEDIPKITDNKENEENPEPLSIKQRIQALKDCINNKSDKHKEENEIKMSVKEKISAIESGNLNSKTTSTKSSVKSFEEFSEEEGDSGVTSDMSRHISDNEEFPELKKMTRYQRAATHSRLFKLLQEVCEGEEDDDDEEKQNENTPDEKKEDAPRRDQLSLPLNNISDESFSSSGITSPGSPVSEKLVTELVQSILKRKKGQIFKNVPKEKIQAAARRILMEEFDDLSTPDSSFLSPLRSTESSTPAQTPQEFYNDYKQYYDSWSDAELLCNENYDILPSKAFKLLQEHSGCNKTGAIAGLLAKCPKLLNSNKNVHQELIKLMEESSSESPSNSFESTEVTSASCPDQSDL